MPRRPIELSNLRILGAATIVTVTVVAWGMLVFAAIEFGRAALEGTRADWVYLVLTMLGAVACMFGAIVMAARLQAMMRVAQRSSTRPLALPLEPMPRPDVVAAPVTAPAATQGRTHSKTDGKTGSKTGGRTRSRRGPLRSTDPGPGRTPVKPQVLESRFTAANVGRSALSRSDETADTGAGKRAVRGYRG